ncbi:5'/3'-nucleotidase SurE [candidate division GN15 bacterium]|uniref:5'-nucleotidase SurE n=1 Tax=candidate division GN15 bacterium TaxID=2072418 RepID=A0A855X0Y0_9BACT|nr:MAG: 5'/3'-nucleotidase SurE [candidate division GN15 bacterium]
MTRKKLILLTNDDGYTSDGVNTLYRVLSRSHTVYLIAPDREQSASSHSLTLNRPLRLHRLDKCRYTTDGTPTDCVMLGIHSIFKKRHPDMIISGINHGGNMGDDCTYSGTVAAAIEGAILRIPSLAVSMANWEPGISMTRAARFVARFLPVYEAMQLDPSIFLNINFPPDSGKPYRGLEYTRQGFRSYRDIVIHKTDPRGRAYYWIGGWPKWRSTPGTDFDAVQRGRISITPMKLDFTDAGALERLRRGLQNS